MVEINLKLAYLEHGWKDAPGGCPVLRDKNFGTEDFEGRKHTIPSHYLATVGRDKKVNHLVDFESDLGKRIEKEVRTSIQHERNLNLDRGREL
jgi:hypothetical protein